MAGLDLSCIPDFGPPPPTVLAVTIVSLADIRALDDLRRDIDAMFTGSPVRDRAVQLVLDLIDERLAGFGCALGEAA